MKCVDCGFDIHECICKDCAAGAYTIVPSSVGDRLCFDLEDRGDHFLSTYSKRCADMNSSVEIKQGIMEAKQAFRDRGYNV